MNGDYLNNQRATFLRTIEDVLGEAQATVTRQKNDYERYTSYEDYGSSFFAEEVARWSKIVTLLTEAQELLDKD